MTKNIPPKIYKFQSFKSEKSIENLRHGQIWFSKPEGLNDPFDCAISIIFTYPEEDMITFVREHYLEDLRKKGKSGEISQRELQYLPNGKPSQELIDQTEKYLKETNQQRRKEFSQNGVACFTTEMNNILMWSHYADGHKGFCLEFDTNYFKFNDKLNLNEVIYNNSFPTLSPLDIVQKPLRVIEPLITKSKDWEHEKEWRLITKEGNSAIEYNPKALTAIYFGCWITKENMEKIATLPAKSAARLFQMQRSETEFKLEYVPYRV